MTVSGRSVATSNGVKIALVSIGVFLSVFLTHMTVIGSPVIPCDGALLAYCWTAEQIGTGLAWALWHGLFSLAVGWAVVALSDQTRSTAGRSARSPRSSTDTALPTRRPASLDS